MKAILLVGSVLISSFGMAAIDSSSFLPHEQAMIEQAFQNKCGRTGVVTELSTQVESVYLYNGIHDDYFTTQLEVEARIEQNMTEILHLEVKSARFSVYDNPNQVLGVFEVVSVNCSANNSGH